jgi:hypothetical protein
LAIAQLPAKAAPKTSALIRIAALTTVSTFCQSTRRRRGGCGLFMAFPLRESGGEIKAA